MSPVSVGAEPLWALAMAIDLREVSLACYMAFMAREASCHCGLFVVRCEGEPAKVSLCHCFDCQRRTGTLFSVAAFFPKSQFTVIQGQSQTYRRPSASGFDVAFNFCIECGSNLWWEAARLPSLIGVAAGAFADPTFPAPEQAVWSEHQHAWLSLPKEIVSHARNPEPRKASE